jgi:Universal stress protein family
VLFQPPADGIVAASENLDLLVMGSRAYGPVRAVMLGGVSRQVIARAACPVLILPRGTAAGLDALLKEPAPITPLREASPGCPCG